MPEKTVSEPIKSGSIRYCGLGIWAAVSPQTGWSPEMRNKAEAIDWLTERGIELQEATPEEPATPTEIVDILTEKLSKIRIGVSNVSLDKNLSAEEIRLALSNVLGSLWED
jgi:hypothetical protein